jgi:hypothetical protein
MLIALAKDYLHSMWTMCFMHLLIVATWAISFIFPSYLATILLAYNYKLGRATAYINVMQRDSLQYTYTCWIWTQWLCVCNVCVGCLAALIVPDIPSSLFVLYSLFAKEICTRKRQKPCYITGELDLILFQGQVFGKCVLWIRLKLMYFNVFRITLDLYWDIVLWYIIYYIILCYIMLYYIIILQYIIIIIIVIITLNHIKLCYIMFLIYYIVLYFIMLYYIKLN